MVVHRASSSQVDRQLDAIDLRLQEGMASFSFVRQRWVRVSSASVIGLGALYFLNRLLAPTLGDQVTFYQRRTLDYWREVPLLISLLDDPDLNNEVAEALGEFGQQAKAAVPRLVPLLKAPDKDLRHAAQVALKKIDAAAAVEAGLK
jgi:hypothetical protein